MSIHAAGIIAGMEKAAARRLQNPQFVEHWQTMVGGAGPGGGQQMAVDVEMLRRAAREERRLRNAGWTNMSGHSSDAAYQHYKVLRGKGRWREAQSELNKGMGNSTLMGNFKMPPIDTTTTTGPNTGGAAARVVDYARRNPGMTAGIAAAGITAGIGLGYAAKKGLERQYGQQFYGKYDKDKEKRAYLEGGRVDNASLGRMALKRKKDKVQPPPEKKPCNEVPGEEQNERK